MCNGPCVSATAGNTFETGILKSSVCWLVFLPEYQEHAGNGTLVAVISFSGKRQNHRGLNETNKEGRMFLTVKNCSTGQAVGIGTL
jgi:hypothetical protein